MAAIATGAMEGLAELVELLPSVSPLQLVGGAAAAYIGVLAWQCLFAADLIRYRHIPGPAPTPLLGNLHTVAWEHNKQLYDAFGAWRAQYGKVFKWFFGQHPIVVVADAELIREVCIKHFNTFHDRSLFYPPQPRAFSKAHGSGLTFVKGHYWASIKSALTPLVHSNGLAAAAKVVTSSIDKVDVLLRAAAKKGEPINMHTLMSATTLAIIGAAAFGLDMDTLTSDPDAHVRNNVLVEAADEALGAQAGTLWSNLIPMALRPVVWPLLKRFPTPQLTLLRESRSKLTLAALQLTKNALGRMGMELNDKIGMEETFGAYPSAREVAALYKDSVPMAGSALDLLAKARDKAGLDAHHIVAQANTILVGGHDTTSFTTTSALYFLATHPEAEARLIAEVDAWGRKNPITNTDLVAFPYLDAVLHETLRLTPPVWCSSRTALKDVTLSTGLFIPKGTNVYLDLFGLHRDPEQFPDPYAFRPERFYDKEGEEAQARHAFAWAGFGAGPRMCLGYKLGTQEVKLILAQLYQRFTFELDTSMTPIAPNGLPPIHCGLHLQYKEGVYFRVHERS